jgi:hypothetical protein
MYCDTQGQALASLFTLVVPTVRVEPNLELKYDVGRYDVFSCF